MKEYIRCEICGSCINIDTTATLIECACGAVAVDSTDYYVRVLGEKENWTWHKED